MESINKGKQLSRIHKAELGARGKEGGLQGSAGWLFVCSLTGTSFIGSKTYLRAAIEIKALFTA